MPPSEKRVSVYVRIPEELHTAIAAAAAERDLSLNYLANRAVADFLDRLIPPDEIQWTRD